MTGPAEWALRMMKLDGQLHSITRRPANISDWLGQLRAAPHPLDAAGVRPELAQQLTDELSRLL